uniref:F5/8 type C domain protein n=1 Tax=Fulvimarina pelagi TaxID=217511 RepID=A0A0P0ZB40_9HYPH|nr:F5/8 type C domain protein [Fulvimarina pelagi]
MMVQDVMSFSAIVVRAAPVPQPLVIALIQAFRIDELYGGLNGRAFSFAWACQAAEGREGPSELRRFVIAIASSFACNLSRFKLLR